MAESHDPRYWALLGGAVLVCARAAATLHAGEPQQARVIGASITPLVFLARRYA